jgi:hypothetical protein
VGRKEEEGEGKEKEKKKDKWFEEKDGSRVLTGFDWVGVVVLFGGGVFSSCFFLFLFNFAALFVLGMVSFFSFFWGRVKWEWVWW